ncbi:hypothetical protein GOP47_0025903 [Adiantum capillus-veneris]|uniref:Uncharacterized protein n=1 Tax=Adiantum capillus-veneris TaxID=13818 RepID=A0A9D4U146_ADICA|nr:hypothetical protein GOP47_0025903 [Adiantum capillus-veneris]
MQGDWKLKGSMDLNQMTPIDVIEDRPLSGYFNGETTEGESSDDCPINEDNGMDYWPQNNGASPSSVACWHSQCSWVDLDPSSYTSKIFFSFDEMTYSLMAKDLGGTETMSLAMLQAIDVRGLFDLKKWNRMKDSLMLCPGIGLEIGCLHLKSTGLKVAFMEDWAHIVHAAHCPLTHDNHLGGTATLKAVQKEWCTDKRQHGLPLDYIKDSITACGCLLKEKIIDCDVAAMPIKVQMLFHQMRTRGNSVGTEWGAMLAEALRLQELKKPYSPQNPDENKRPFILLIQDEWMLQKAWVENLLPQVPKDKRDDVYNRMSNLMHATSEDIFDARCDELLQVYQAHENIRRYVSTGWCGKTCMWRSRWPRFGRLFQHGNVDTTNLVERLWQYVKYTLLNAQINRSLLVLLNALVGDSVHGTYIGGTLLEFFKQKQEIADSGHSVQALSHVDLQPIVGAGEDNIALEHDNFDVAETVVSNIDNEIGSCIYDMRSILQSLEEHLAALTIPKEIELPAKGSIKQVQAHVTLTRLGHGMPVEASGASKEQVLEADLPPSKGPTTGVLRRKHQRGRSRVRFQRKPRIHCPHCCSKTLMLDPLESISCHTCHALLPLLLRHAPGGAESSLLNRHVTLFGESIQKGMIVCCKAGEVPTEERSFTICLLDGSVLETVLASQQRMALVSPFATIFGLIGWVVLGASYELIPSADFQHVWLMTIYLV